MPIKKLLKKFLPKFVITFCKKQQTRVKIFRTRHGRNLGFGFSVGLAEHCNLRCAGCDHFSPVAEPVFADVKEFEKDFKRLSELFPSYHDSASKKRRSRKGPHINRIKLMGGEPLLNSDIAEFLPIARRCFPDAAIEIVTNGLLLPKMDEKFWNACRENRIVIRPTKYPVNFDYDAAEKLAAGHGVEYSYFNDTNVVKSLYKCPLDIEGKQNIRKNFRNCFKVIHCSYFQHGRFYTCTVAPTAHHLNKKFGTKVLETPEDSIDIYTAKSGQEVVDFLRKPIPFCKYCIIKKQSFSIPFRQSKSELSEWTLD